MWERFSPPKHIIIIDSKSGKEVEPISRLVISTKVLRFTFRASHFSSAPPSLPSGPRITFSNDLCTSVSSLAPFVRHLGPPWHPSPGPNVPVHTVKLMIFDVAPGDPKGSPKRSPKRIGSSFGGLPGPPWASTGPLWPPHWAS